MAKTPPRIKGRLPEVKFTPAPRPVEKPAAKAEIAPTVPAATPKPLTMGFAAVRKAIFGTPQPVEPALIDRKIIPPQGGSGTAPAKNPPVARPAPVSPRNSAAARPQPATPAPAAKAPGTAKPQPAEATPRRSAPPSGGPRPAAPAVPLGQRPAPVAPTATPVAPVQMPEAPDPASRIVWRDGPSTRS